jgi:hypothetical protein
MFIGLVKTKLHANPAQKNDVNCIFFCQFAEILLTKIEESQFQKHEQKRKETNRLV